MSSEKYESLEDEFGSTHQKLQNIIKNTIPNSYGEQKKKLIRTADEDINDCNLLLQEMENELKSAPSHLRNEYVGRIRNFKHSMEKMNKDLKRISQGGARENLLGGVSGFNNDKQFQAEESSQKRMAIENTHVLNSASASIARSRQVAQDTEYVGTAAMGELYEQRETLEGARNKIVGMQENLSLSSRIINSMSRNVFGNKIILLFIIILEVIILATVIYIKFFM